MAIAITFLLLAQLAVSQANWDNFIPPVQRQLMYERTHEHTQQVVKVPLPKTSGAHHENTAHVSQGSNTKLDHQTVSTTGGETSTVGDRTKADGAVEDTASKKDASASQETTTIETTTSEQVPQTEAYPPNQPQKPVKGGRLIEHLHHSETNDSSSLNSPTVRREPNNTHRHSHESSREHSREQNTDERATNEASSEHKAQQPAIPDSYSGNIPDGSNSDEFSLQQQTYEESFDKPVHKNVRKHLRKIARGQHKNAHRLRHADLRASTRRNSKHSHHSWARVKFAKPNVVYSARGGNRYARYEAGRPEKEPNA